MLARDEVLQILGLLALLVACGFLVLRLVPDSEPPSDLTFSELRERMQGGTIEMRGLVDGPVLADWTCRLVDRRGVELKRSEGHFFLEECLEALNVAPIALEPGKES